MRKRWAKAAAVIVALLALEAGATAVLYVREGAREPLAAAFPRRYFLTRLVWAPFVPLPVPLDGGQRFVGVLRSTPDVRRSEGLSAWRAMFPVDALLGFRLGRGVAALHDGRYLYVTNDQGFASSGETRFHYEPRKPAGVFRVIMLGGSAVFGDGAAVPSHNLPAQLQAALSRRLPGRRIEVINAGVSGYVSGQEFLYLESELTRFEPDLVVVYDGWNDMHYTNELLAARGEEADRLKTAVHYRVERRFNEAFGPVRAAASLGLSLADGLRTALEQSAFFDLLAESAQRALAREPAAVPYSPASVAIYRENLELMLFCAGYHKFAIGLFLQPLMGVDGKPLAPREARAAALIRDLPLRRSFYADARRMFEDLARRHAGERGVCVRDFSQALAGVARPLYADSGHLRLAGNRLVAGRLVAALFGCGLLPR